MKNKKIFLGIFLTMVILFFSCFQKQDTESDFIAEPIDGGKAVQIIEYIGSKWEINIPSRIQKLPVTHIGESAFKNKKLISVTIPNGVTHIGNYAFSQNQLANITIPNSVTHIGYDVFSNNKLTSVVIPNSVVEIRQRAFGDNDDLIRIKIGADVSLVGSDFLNWSFDNAFPVFYNENGKKAGTYIFNNGNWSYKQ